MRREPVSVCFPPLADTTARLALNLAASIAAGTLFGLAVYFVNFYGFTALFPWFAMARGPISIFAHAMFGLVLGWAYHAIALRDARNAEVAEARAPTSRQAG